MDSTPSGSASSVKMTTESGGKAWTRGRPSPPDRISPRGTGSQTPLTVGMPGCQPPLEAPRGFADRSGVLQIVRKSRGFRAIVFVYTIV